ncbi:LrgB family protein [Kineococcus gynurae]|uniref:LrgB family protein n=1 Tax=Kineococcus gynurae TaxID=452979 RepID=A0ABV5LRZ3_9ACTN
MNAVLDAVTTAPGFGMFLTVGAYVGAVQLHHRLGRPALLAPVFVTMVVVALVLHLLGIPYPDYLASVSVLVILLGPATVALALPLLRSGPALLASCWAVLTTLLVTGVVSLGVTVAATTLLGASPEIVRTTLPRNVTSPVALTLAETLHGVVALSVVLTLVSGVLGAVLGPGLLSLARVRDPRARGFAIGLSAHGIGTARALAESDTAGGWSSAAMVLNALAMTVALPFVAGWLGG